MTGLILLFPKAVKMCYKPLRKLRVNPLMGGFVARAIDERVEHLQGVVEGAETGVLTRTDPNMIETIRDLLVTTTQDKEESTP